jgi:hypothetical protein
MRHAWTWRITAIMKIQTIRNMTIYACICSIRVMPNLGLINWCQLWSHGHVEPRIEAIVLWCALPKPPLKTHHSCFTSLELCRTLQNYILFNKTMNMLHIIYIYILYVCSIYVPNVHWVYKIYTPNISPPVHLPGHHLPPPGSSGVTNRFGVEIWRRNSSSVDIQMHIL